MEKLPQGRDSELVVQKTDNETLLYDTKSHKALCLNKTSSLIWAHCNGNTNVKDFEWCAVNTPKEEIRSSVPGGKFIASFKDSENKEEAMKLMAAFSSKENNEKYCADTFNLSARVDTDVPYTSNKEDFTVFSEDLKVTPAFTALEWKASSLNKVYSYIREQIVQVLMGNISAEEATMNIDKEAAKF